MEKIKYLNNKDFILELQRSKATYSYFISPEYAMYDVILPSLDLLTPQLLQDSIILKAKRLSTKLSVVDPETIDPETIVFRVMTDSHIPPEPDITVRLRKKSSIAGEFIKKTNFPPFKHYIMREGEIIEVGRSHWKDGLQNGTFCIDHGHMTNKLAKMFMLLTENISHKNNWRNYSWKEDFIGSAITHLCQVGLQFDESRSSNPFAFFTTIISHCFVRVLNLEKRGQDIKNDLLIMAGVQPSFSRQIDNEIEQRAEESEKIEKIPAKRGRKPKSQQITHSDEYS